MKDVSIFWDVDGVFNSFSNRPPKSMTGWEGEWKEERVSTSSGDSWRILWSTELVEAVNALSKLPNVTMKWLTTWQGDAAKFITPALGILGGGEWDVLYCKDPEALHSMYSGWWKFQNVQEDFAESAPDGIVWVDDDIKQDLSSIIWMRNLEEVGKGHLVSPSSYLGVTKKEMDGIMEFVSS